MVTDMIDFEKLEFHHRGLKRDRETFVEYGVSRDTMLACSLVFIRRYIVTRRGVGGQHKSSKGRWEWGRDKTFVGLLVLVRRYTLQREGQVDNISLRKGVVYKLRSTFLAVT